MELKRAGTPRTGGCDEARASCGAAEKYGDGILRADSYGGESPGGDEAGL